MCFITVHIFVLNARLPQPVCHLGRFAVPAWLKHDGLKSLTVKAGQSVRWEVKIGGEPNPDVKWSKGG